MPVQLFDQSQSCNDITSLSPAELFLAFSDAREACCASYMIILTRLSQNPTGATL